MVRGGEVLQSVHPRNEIRGVVVTKRMVGEVGEDNAGGVRYGDGLVDSVSLVVCVGVWVGV